MTSRGRPAFAAALLAAALGAPARGQDAPPPARGEDLLFVGGSIEDRAPGGGGGEVGVDYVRSLSPRLTLLAGFAHLEREADRRTFARVGSALRASHRTALEATIERGSGEQLDLEVTHAVYRAAVTQTLVERRLSARFEDEYLEIGPARGNLVKAGISVLGEAFGEISFSYQWSTSGNLEAEALSARIDVRRGRLGYLAGIADGRAAPTAIGLVSVLPPAPSTELFAGLRFPAGRQEITLVLDTLASGETRRNALLVGIRIPLSPR